jgi:hypothetical protein
LVVWKIGNSFFLFCIRIGMNFLVVNFFDTQEKGYFFLKFFDFQLVILGFLFVVTNSQVVLVFNWLKFLFADVDLLGFKGFLVHQLLINGLLFSNLLIQVTRFWTELYFEVDQTEAWIDFVIHVYLHFSFDFLFKLVQKIQQFGFYFSPIAGRKGIAVDIVIRDVNLGRQKVLSIWNNKRV